MQGLFWVLLSVPVTWLPPSGMDDSPLSGAGTLSAPSLLKPDTRVRLWHAARSVQGHCRMNFCPRSPLCRLNNNPAKMSPSLSLEADNVTLCGEGCDQAKGLEMGDHPGLSVSAPYQHRLTVQEWGGSESHVRVETGREGRVTGLRALGCSSLSPGQSRPPPPTPDLSP